MDHTSTLGIAKSTTMQSTSTDKLNLKLIQASQYLSQFNLNIWHKLGKLNLVPNTLSHLTAKINPRDKTDKALEDVFAYNFTIVELNDDFKTHLKEEYSEDKYWWKVIKMLDDH